jgi:ribosomal protein S18 acetylase RimI-like enzyme
VRQQTLRFGESWARIAPWRGGGGAAHLVVGPEASATSDVVRRCVDQARQAGYRSVMTNAVGTSLADSYVAAGFEVRERLHLLAIDLHRPPTPPERPLSRPGRRARAAAVRVDDAAFDGFWRLGHAGLRDAVAATPVSRFRVGRATRKVVAYGITGRAEGQGYLQRVAVDPAVRRQGWGRAVVADGLGWLWQHGCTRAYVNTQLHNDAAVALYESVGFRRLPGGLCVLGRPL